MSDDYDALAHALKVNSFSAGTLTSVPETPAASEEFFAASSFSVSFGIHEFDPEQHWHAHPEGTAPGLPIQVAEIGGLIPVSGPTNEIIRGFAEFDITGKLPADSATLKFRVFDVTDISGVPVGGLFGQTTPYEGLLDVVVYSGDNSPDLADYDQAGIGTLAGQINTTGAAAEQEFTLDITDQYNELIGDTATSLGVKIKTPSEPIGELTAITFYKFRIAINDGAVAEDRGRTFVRAESDKMTASMTLANFPVSMACWAKMSSTGELRIVMGIYDNTATDQEMVEMHKTSGDKLRVLLNKAGLSNNADSVASFILNQWHFCGAVVTSTQIKCYFDDATPVTTAHSRAWPVTNKVALGVREDASPGDFWNGVLDEAAIWDGTALTDGNMAALYNGGIGLLHNQIVPAGIPAPTHYWNLNENDPLGADEDKVSTLDLTDSGTADAQGIPAGQV